MLTSNQFELLSTTTDFPAEIRRTSLAVDLSSSHVVLLHARAHDYLAFCVQGDRGQLRAFCPLLSSLAFAFVLPSFSLIPWLFSLRPSSRRLSRDELTSFPLPAPCRLSLALVLWAALRRLLEIGGATAALTPAEFAGSRRCCLPAPSATCLSMTCWWALASNFVKPKAAKPCFAGFFAWSIASLQRARKLAKRRGSRGARFVVREAIRVSSQ